MAKNGFLIFDSDMHIMEPPDLWTRYIDPEFRDVAPRGRTSENVRDLGVIWPDDPPDTPTVGALPQGHNYERNQALYRDHSRRGWTADVQLEAMDVEGLDVAVLFPSRGLSVLTHPNREPRFAAAIARAYNDWMYDFCQADTRRLLGAGMISVYDIDDAVRETRRVVEELGFKAVFLRSNIVTGKVWHDPYYEPLWDTLDELSIPLGFHEATRTRSGRQSGDRFEPNFGLRRIYAQPMEQMLALGSFCAGGILERHPRLQVAFLEANCSWLPWLLWRMDEGYELEGDIFMPQLTMPPSAYFHRQCYASVEPDETPARYVVEELGAERLVFSTDYPHGDARYPRAVESFLELPLPDDAKRKILWDNCARFYHVTEAPQPVSARRAAESR
jgi:predicted TIM-barrel fold metal-dependent hydrolase